MNGQFRFITVPFLFLFWSCSGHAADITLHYGGSAQFELHLPTGRHLLIDTASPNDLLFSPGPEDILLTSHRHPDHWERSFQTGFPGKQLFMEKGPIRLPDVEVYGLASAHSPQDPIGSGAESNWIFLILTNNLRIAHFGDIGQEQLTDEQLHQLGRIDIAIMQFINPRSDMSIESNKGFRLMQQLKPKLIIPTHHAGLPALQRANDYWPCFASDREKLALNPRKLPEKTSLLILGNLADIAVEELGYAQWPE